MPDPNPYGPWDVPKLAWIEHDGTWYPGQLRMWRPAREHPGCGVEGLAGSVRYHVGAGLQHVAWVHQDRIRPRGEGHPDPNGVDEAEPEAPFA